MRNDELKSNFEQSMVSSSQHFKQTGLISQRGYYFGMPIPNEVDFDWDMALSELESEKHLLIKNLLRTHNGPICGLSDPKGMTLLHHAVLKGAPGKTKLLIEFAKS